MRTLSLLISFAALALTPLPVPARQQPAAQQPQPGQNPVAATVAIPQSVAQSARKTVAFVTVIYASGASLSAVIGTGFFVSVEDKRLGENLSFGYFVTNRHVAQPGIELGTPHDPAQVRLRLNLKIPEGGNDSIEQPVALGGSVHWYFPEDSSVDLAVIPIAPDVVRYDYLTIPTSAFATEDHIKSESIDVGDQVIFTGFFSSFPGQKRIEPIVRQGILAMMPDEPMQTTLHKPGRLYLADAHAFHGNSGSPIFVSLGGARRGSFFSGERYLLLGIISGYFPESAGYTVPAAAVLTAEVHDNSGIAAVVPADELMKLLNCRALQGLRDQEAARISKKP